MAVPVDAEESLAGKFEAIFPHLDERQRRLLLGAEARAAGPWRVRAVAGGRGPRRRCRWGWRAGVGGLSRGPGAAAGRGPQGARRHWTRGWCRRCWRWWSRMSGATRSRRCGGRPSRPAHLAGELTRQGHRCQRRHGGGCCRRRGSACRATPRRWRGQRHPDRDAQFRYINEQAREHLAAGRAGDQRGRQEEGAGRAVRAGRPGVAAEGRPGAGRRTTTSRTRSGQAIPYGVYDLAANAGLVNVGTDHNTAAFAVESIRRWWHGRPATTTRTRGGC